MDHMPIPVNAASNNGSTSSKTSFTLGCDGGGGPCSITLNTSPNSENQRKRSCSASGPVREGPEPENNDCINFLSPTQQYVSNNQTRRLLLVDSRGRRRSASPHSCHPKYPLPPFLCGGDAGLQRSPSNSTVQSHGSDVHFGSSVTFCQASPARTVIGGGTENVRGGPPVNHKNMAELRRSCSAMFMDAVSDRTALQCPGGNSFYRGAANLGSGSMVATNNDLQMKMNFLRRASAAPPEINVDESVMSALQGPRGAGGVLANSRSFGSAYHLQSQAKSVMVTSRGSFLAVNQSPLEFRESTVSVSYPNFEGKI